MSETVKNNTRFLRQIFLTVVGIIVFSAYPLYKYAEIEIVKTVGCGLLLSVINVLMGYAAVEYSFNKPYAVFVQIVLGGIVVRLLVMVTLLLLLILIFHFHVVALVVSLYASYVIFLIMEISYIQGRAQKEIQI